MVRLVKTAAAAALLVAPSGAAFAQNGGDRMPAGGAFMSSYARPYADSRSPYGGGLRPGTPPLLSQPDATGSLRQPAAAHPSRHGRARR
ncbi:MAG: hypothetical protein PGN34_00410 [Methylobacterium frigidaeris]